MRAERRLGVLERHRRIEHAAEFLPDIEMSRRRLALAGGLVDFLYHLFVHGAGFRHAVRRLEFLDCRDGRLAERAVELLPLEIPQVGEDLLDADDAIALRAPRHENA